ncbi:hypothetical protein Aduo_007792 [Ancylostoma duodenale]
MRVLLLTLLLVVTVSVSGGFFGKLGDKVKKTFGGEGSVGQKLKNITMNKFEKVKKIFGSVSVAKIRERLSKLKDKVKKMLELTPRMLASLKEKLAKLRPIKRVQSDIVLTEEQADEMEKDIDDVISGNPRRRRQAFKNRRYPGTLWENGVNYYFDYNANEKLRSPSYGQDPSLLRKWVLVVCGSTWWQTGPIAWQGM